MRSPLAVARGIAHGAELRGSPRRALRRIDAIGRSGGPIVVGPWLSEVGIELLFWIPMLRWFVERHSIDPARVTAISRGGVGGWYSGIAGRYLDVLEHFDPEDLRRWNDERVAAEGSGKQTRVTEPDRLILEAAGLAAGGQALLHPSLMHGLYRTFWPWEAPMHRLSTVLDRASFAPISRPPPLPGLPDRYVAVKAYFNQVFPDTEPNRAFLVRLLGGLAARTDVVLLETGLAIDDHREFGPDAAARIHTLAGSVSPRDNLDAQTRAIAGADALIGTYGGLAYLPPFIGVPSYCFYSSEDFNPTHRDIYYRGLRRLSERGGGAGFVTIPTSSAQKLIDLAA